MEIIFLLGSVLFLLLAAYYPYTRNIYYDGESNRKLALAFGGGARSKVFFSLGMGMGGLLFLFAWYIGRYVIEPQWVAARSMSVGYTAPLHQPLYVHLVLLGMTAILFFAAIFMLFLERPKDSIDYVAAWARVFYSVLMGTFGLILLFTWIFVVYE
jgi:hypothetical protein